MRRSVKNTLRAGALCLILLACALFTTALAAEGDVTYVKYSWEEGIGLSSTTETLHEGEYTLIDSPMSLEKWGEDREETWYVIQGTINNTNSVVIHGNVSIILTEGCDFTAPRVCVDEGTSLTIYGKEKGTGRLTVTGAVTSAGIGGMNVNSGDITIHGGIINVTGGKSVNSGGAGIGGGDKGNCSKVTIYSGVVTATGNNGGAGIGGGANSGDGGDIKIYGGTVMAQGSVGVNGPGHGIGGGSTELQNGTLTIKGDAFVVASSIGDTSKQNEWNGVVFIGTTGNVYGTSVTLTNDAEVPAGYTLAIGDGQTLTVAHGATLAVKGGVTFEVTGKLEVAEGGALAFYSGAKIDLSTVTGDVTFPEMGTGTGTADDPYTISTADGLRALAGIVDNGYDFAGKTVVLDEDIDLKGDDSNQWNPIGSYGSGGTNKLPFNGAFDGGGNTISGLYINTGESAAGLFAYIGENGNVQNLAVSGTVNANANSGGIAAYNYGTISNCYADVDVTVEKSYAGGIAGSSDGRVENCYNLGDIKGESSVAGIVGAIYGSGLTIENCYNFGNITGSGGSWLYVGGILGSTTTASGAIAVSVNCYCLDTSVSDGNSHGIPLTAGQFADSNSFGGWDFENTWVMSAELGRPVLRRVPESAGFEIDFENEGARALGNHEISADGDEWVSGAGILKVTPGGTIYVREGYGAEAAAVRLPARPDAPAGALGGALSISGVDATMEYSADGGATWTPCGGETVTGLEPGEYQVRVAASQEAQRFRSEAVTVTVTAAAGGQDVNVPETYGIELVVGEGGEARASFSNASAGAEITVTATPDEGYELAYITVDGERISGNTFTMPAHDVTVRVYFTDGASTLPFADTPEGAWYYDAVSYVYANGLMDGVSATTFAPDANMTRAMLVTILWRMEGGPVVNCLMPFNDVDGGAWYAEAVRWAASEGIVTGLSATEFAPNAEITREQFAAILHRYAGAPVGGGMAVSEFTDGASVSDYATDAITWALSEGILTGMGDGTLAPQGTATRAHAAAMLMRFAER